MKKNTIEKLLVNKVKNMEVNSATELFTELMLDTTIQSKWNSEFIDNNPEYNTKEFLLDTLILNSIELREKYSTRLTRNEEFINFKIGINGKNKNTTKIQQVGLLLGTYDFMIVEKFQETINTDFTKEERTEAKEEFDRFIEEQYYGNDNKELSTDDMNELKYEIKKAAKSLWNTNKHIKKIK